MTWKSASFHYIYFVNYVLPFFYRGGVGGQPVVPGEGFFPADSKIPSKYLLAIPGWRFDLPKIHVLNLKFKYSF